MVLKKRTKKLLIIALAAVTVVWFVASYLHIQGYNRYLQEEYASYIERFGEEGGQLLWDIRDVSTSGQFFGYAWPNGLFLIQSALIIFVAWIFVINSTRARGVFEIRWKYVLLITFVLFALSALHISHPSTMYGVIIHFGFPFSWLEAFKSNLHEYAPWEFALLNGLFPDFLIYGLIATIAVILYEKKLKHIDARA